MESLSFQPVISYWLIGLVFGMGLLMLLVGPSFVQLPPRRRWTLACLRLGALGLALLAIVRPGCVQQIEKNQAAVVLFLVDVTRSMQHPHVTDDSTRWGAVQQVIKENSARFKKLADSQIDVRFFGFDNRVTPMDVIDGKVALPPSPEGGETDIGSSLYETSLDVRDERLLGLFLLSDGMQNAADPRIDVTQAAQTLNDLEVPLYAVQFGLPGDNGQLRDVAVTNFAEQHIVNVKNDLTVRATIVSRGYANQDIPVDLFLIDRAGKETRIQSTVIRPTSSYEATNVELVYRPTEPGEFRLKIRTNPMPGELAIRNNELNAFLTVNDKGMRVLMLCGDLGWEQSFLRRSLPATDFIQLDFVPIYPNTRSTWPRKDLEELFRDSAYDVFIICDLDASALYDARTYTKGLDALTEAVYGGKGLLMLGGYHSFGAGGYQRTPLADVLPITMKANEKQDFDADVRRDLHIQGPIRLRPAKDHFLTRLGGEENRKTIWKKLPPLVGANRFGVKDNAEILLESDDDVQRPILVAGDVGGRVLAFGGDSTWRWRMKGFKPEYDQFWRQAVLWLAFWDARNDDSLSIVLSQRRFQPKAFVKFNVNVKNINGEVVDDATFHAVLVNPAGDEQVVTIQKSGDSYVSELDPEWVAESGLYLIRVEGFRNGQSIGTTEREFMVMDRDKEKSNPGANPELMARLASQTSQYGGRAMVPEEVAPMLDELIAHPPVTRIEIPMKWRFGDSFPESATFLMVFVGLLAVEWFLRKRWGLV